MDFNSLEEYYAYVKKAHELTVIEDVPNTVKEVSSQEIKQQLDTYKSKRYERRDVGGLDDTKNMKTLISKVGNTIGIDIVNETPLNPPNDGRVRNYRLDEVVEYGQNYEYPIRNRDENIYSYLKPRPFTEKTNERLRLTKEHEKAYIKSMKAKGIKLD